MNDDNLSQKELQQLLGNNSLLGFAIELSAKYYKLIISARLLDMVLKNPLDNSLDTMPYVQRAINDVYAMIEDLPPNKRREAGGLLISRLRKTNEDTEWVMDFAGEKYIVNYHSSEHCATIEKVDMKNSLT